MTPTTPTVSSTCSMVKSWLKISRRNSTCKKDSILKPIFLTWFLWIGLGIYLKTWILYTLLANKCELLWWTQLISLDWWINSSSWPLANMVRCPKILDLHPQDNLSIFQHVSGQTQTHYKQFFYRLNKVLFLLQYSCRWTSLQSKAQFFWLMGINWIGIILYEGIL